MEFGIQFFPDVKTEQKPADQYFREALALVDLAEPLGFTHVRIVEHHFHYYGGYSPNPFVFLAAAAARTQKMRLVTGACLPAFNNPLKIAGEIGMLDAISNGRLDVGFARAFLPHEFRRFGISPDESVARYREGIEQVARLLTEENITSEGEFHQIRDTTTLPRPTQQPRPPFYVAALATPSSFEYAGTMGHNVMCVPMLGAAMKELISTYRNARKAAGHEGPGQVMLAHHMFCQEDGALAREIARPQLDAYLKSLVEGASDWLDGMSSADYPGYDKIIEMMQKENTDSQIAKGAAWIGTPVEIIENIKMYQEETGGFEHASLQVNFHNLPFDEAQRSMKMFAAEVMPHFNHGASA
jgi:alkanesulfonate monooxygenase SsuD/methylene tetrahydromethanopterin reductase-like flavin-dependent oxidoreductase (luciferase family)